MRLKVSFFGASSAKLLAILLLPFVSESAFSYSNSSFTCTHLDQEHLAALSEEVRQANLAIVNDCVASSAEKEVSVSYATISLCKTDIQGNLVRYRLKNTGDGFRVRVHLGLVPPEDTSDERASELLSRVQQCSSALQEVWARYKIDFQATFALTRERRERQFEHIVDIVDGEGRSTAGTWYLEDAYLCEVILHEVGHLIGLNDEYEDDDCPERSVIAPAGFPTSVMDDSCKPLEHLEFFPRHISSILAPLCSNEIHFGRIKSNRDIAIYFNNTDWSATEDCPDARFENGVLADSNENNWTWKEGFSAAWAGGESFDPYDVAAHSLLMEHSEDSEKKLVMSLKSYDNRTDKYCFYYELADLTCVLCAVDVTLQIPTLDS